LSIISPLPNPLPEGIGIYTSPTAPSPKGEGWDEGNVNACFTLLTPALSNKRGSSALPQLIVFIMQKSCVDTYARRERE